MAHGLNHSHQPSSHQPRREGRYFRCLFTSFVISNMLTVALPPNTGLSESSALIMRRFFASCSLFFLMYAQSFFVTSVRGIGFDPTTSLSAALGCTGFMNAALGFLAAFFAMSSPCEGRPTGRRTTARLPHSMNKFAAKYYGETRKTVNFPLSALFLPRGGRQIGRMVGQTASGAVPERGANPLRQRHFRQRFRVDEHVHRFNRDDDRRLAR